MKTPLTRREAIRAALVAGAAAALARPIRATPPREPLFRISLAQWSYHRAVRSGEMTTLDFPGAALDRHGIDAVEFVSTLFERRDLAAETGALHRRCADLGVRSLLIMVDGEGALGDPNDAQRAQAVDNHRKWLDAAKALGCHSIRVNAESRGEPGEQERLAADGLRALCERADPLGLNVIVENHWGLSSTAPWLMAVMRRVDHPRVGTLPDFGNFDPALQDRYEGVRAMMSKARAVSAKSADFDADGQETTTDYARMLRIVTGAGYRGHVGIEYEGSRLSEPDGVDATLRLLDRVHSQLQHETREP
ncbi:MAG: sugar phosphate isomerase/epimerase [Phycisphaerales bacterium]|nr:sugar phosphate isomerase/epimerase [Phycisphaerales bacterium]